MDIDELKYKTVIETLDLQINELTDKNKKLLKENCELKQKKINC